MRRFIVLALLGASLLVAARPAQAAYDWCSVDPILTFNRRSLLAGILGTDVVDVQVLVPLSALPLSGTARLNVRVPSNVEGIELLNTSLPLLFTIQTSFAQVKPAANTSRYDVDLALIVPTEDRAFPVRLLVTSLSTGEISVIEGVAGQHVRTTIPIID